MRWGDFRRSENVDDRRSEGPSLGSGGFRVGRGGLGIGAVFVILLVSWVFGIDPRMLLEGADVQNGGGPSSEATYPGSSQIGSTSADQSGTPGDQAGQFVAAVLGDTEDRWTEIFRSLGRTYEPPRLVLFSGATRSACGTAQSAMGPFYCPYDQRVYLDTGFFREIETRLGGCNVGSKTCEFSEAYVIAHEVGHHVQDQLGILGKATELQRRVGDADANQIQVRVELQADCFAGLWANRSQAKLKFLEEGDVDAALQTASAIGDDTLQRRSQGYVVPDAFTHGSSAQRRRWFAAGLQSGRIESCDTFSTAQP
jgi:predicted metalloprotease